MIRRLRSLGMTPDMAYYASLGSIALSLVLWFLPRSVGNGERPGQLAIFVGLWPPTLMLLGHALASEEAADRQLTGAADPDLSSGVTLAGARLR